MFKKIKLKFSIWFIKRHRWSPDLSKKVKKLEKELKKLNKGENIMKLSLIQLGAVIIGGISSIALILSVIDSIIKHPILLGITLISGGVYFLAKYLNK